MIPTTNGHNGRSSYLGEADAYSIAAGLEEAGGRMVITHDAAGVAQGGPADAAAGLARMTDTTGREWAWNPAATEWQLLHRVVQWQPGGGLSGGVLDWAKVYYPGLPARDGMARIYAIPQNQPILGPSKDKAVPGDLILIPGLVQPRGAPVAPTIPPTTPPTTPPTPTAPPPITHVVANGNGAITTGEKFWTTGRIAVASVLLAAALGIAGAMWMGRGKRKGRRRKRKRKRKAKPRRKRG